jgi:hypothetical protein
MGLRRWAKRLERRSREDLRSFVLKDGSRYFYNPQSGTCYLHAMACFRAQQRGEDLPEPPEVIKALTRARDRTLALEQVGTDSFPYDKQIFLERGELAPRSVVAVD